MSTATHEAVKFAKFLFIVLVLVAVTEFGLLPLFGDSLAGLARVMKLLTLAIVAALIAEEIEKAVR